MHRYIVQLSADTITSLMSLFCLFALPIAFQSTSGDIAT